MVHIRYENTATGEDGGALVQTEDKEALSPDPALREDWIRGIHKVTLTLTLTLH